MLWLRRRPAAVALIQPLAWDLPQTVVAALKNRKKKKKKERKGIRMQTTPWMNFEDLRLREISKSQKDK